MLEHDDCDEGWDTFCDCMADYEAKKLEGRPRDTRKVQSQSVDPCKAGLLVPVPVCYLDQVKKRTRELLGKVSDTCSALGASFRAASAQILETLKDLETVLTTTYLPEDCQLPFPLVSSYDRWKSARGLLQLSATRTSKDLQALASEIRRVTVTTKEVGGHVDTMRKLLRRFLNSCQEVDACTEDFVGHCNVAVVSRKDKATLTWSVFFSVE
jgi:hypothetical protein